MSKKEEFDLDKEVEKISRKSDISIKKSEYSFNNQIKKLDNEIERVINNKIKEFDDNKKLTEDYLKIDYKNDTINRYREKLKKM